jgi:spore coat polysaccharide biosynthesis protein SpsF (cytidylyltransferase family)
MKKKCRFCKDKTEDYKKINKIKVFLCSTNCEINYVLKRFLHKNYKYDNNQGNVSFILPKKGGRTKSLKGWLE